MKIDRAPAPKTPQPRANLLKDGNIVARGQYLSCALTARVVLTELKPEHQWTVDLYIAEPMPAPPSPVAPVYGLTPEQQQFLKEHGKRRK